MLKVMIGTPLKVGWSILDVTIVLLNQSQTIVDVQFKLNRRIKMSDIFDHQMDAFDSLMDDRFHGEEPQQRC